MRGKCVPAHRRGMSNHRHPVSWRRVQWRSSGRRPTPFGSRHGSRHGSLRDDPRAMRAVAALGAFAIAEQAVWVTVLVVASRRGGPVETGWVSAALLAPAAVVAPRAARRLSGSARRAPLAAGYAIQAAALVLAAAVLMIGLDTRWFYAAAALVTITTVLSRPAHHAFLAHLGSPVPATVATGAVSGGAQLLGPLAAAAMLHVAGPSQVLLLGAGLSLAATALTAGLGRANPRLTIAAALRHDRAAASASVLRGRTPAARRCVLLVFGVFAAVALVIGAIETLATQVAQVAQVAQTADTGRRATGDGSTTGLLMAAAGAGLLVGAWWCGQVMLRHSECVAMRLGALCTATGLLATGVPLGLAWSMAAFAVSGVGMQAVTVAGWVLLHRRVCSDDPAQVSTVFGVLEAQQLAANGVGAMAVGLALGLTAMWPVLLVAAMVVPLAMSALSIERLAHLPAPVAVIVPPSVGA
jgi:hypothetical protein